jgi:ankyrin repeat protein
VKEFIDGVLEGKINEKFISQRLKKIKNDLGKNILHITYVNPRDPSKPITIKNLTAFEYVCWQIHTAENIRLSLLKKLHEAGATHGHALLLAVSVNAPSIVDFLIEIGADPNQLSKNIQGEEITPLISAVWNVRLELIEILLKKKPKLYNKNCKYSLLISAIESNPSTGLFEKFKNYIKENPEAYPLVQLYKELECEANRKTFLIFVDFLLSLPKPDLEFLLKFVFRTQDELLLDKIFAVGGGSNTLFEMTLPNGKKIKRTALHLLAEGNSDKLVKTLLEKYKIDLFCLSEDGITAFSMAVSNAQLAVMKAMLNSRRELINFRNKDQFETTPLHIAAADGKYEVVEWLLLNDADPQLLNKNHCNPFYSILYYGHSRLISLFRKHRVDLDAPLKMAGYNELLRPIIIAVIFENEELIGELCKEGVTPNTHKKDKYSPLTHAVLMFKFGCVKKLLECGAIPSAYHLAFFIELINPTSEVYEIINLLITNPQFNPKEYVENFGNSLLTAVLRNDVELTKILLPYFDMFSSNHKTNPFFKAIILNRVEVLEVFFEYITHDRNLYKQVELLIDQACEILSAEDQINIRQLYHKFQPKLPVDTAIAPKSIQAPSSISSQDTFFKEESSRTSYASHAYLRGELKFSDEEIEKLKEEMRLKRKKVKSAVTEQTKDKALQEEFTWFEDAMYSSRLHPIEKSKALSYIWLAEDALQNQGCDNLEKFKNRERYKFDEHSVKQLSGSKYTRQFEINGKTYNIMATHELKDSNSANRILLFPVKSDDTGATVYIGAVFKKEGFHHEKDKSMLLSDFADRLSVIKITLPENLKQPILFFDRRSPLR